MKPLEQFPASFIQPTCWNNDPWIGSELLLKRNIDKQHFPQKMGAEQKIRTASMLKEALLNLRILQNPHYFELSSLSPQEREFWEEKFLSRESLQHVDSSEGIIVDDSGQFSAMIHRENHLQLYLTSPKHPFPEPWNLLSSIENSLTKFFTFSYNPRFGYLTSDPSQAGTGLIVRAFLHLPALIQKEILLDFIPEDVLIYGLGETSQFIGDLVVVENRYKLGLNEETIIHILEQNASALVAKELELREEMKKNPPMNLRDKVSKAHGLLLFSHQLKTEEALSALSLVKLGEALGWISGLDPHFFSTLFFSCRRAHLFRLGHAASNDELLEARASLIRTCYKDAHLEI